MKINLYTVIVSMVVVFGLACLITGELQWGVIAGLFVGVGGAKWLRVKKQAEKEELEYDERVNQNIKRYSIQAFSFSNLLLFVYLLFSKLVLSNDTIELGLILFYLGGSFILVYYVVPYIARKL